MAFIYHIELTNVCDLTCSYCSLNASPRLKGRMSRETFEKVVAHMQRSSPLNLMVLHHFGEPLLHPDLEEFLAIADRAQLNPGFSTNGQTLTPERFERLVQSGLRWMVIVFHEPEGEAAFHALRDRARELGVVLWGRELVPEERPYDPNAIVTYGIERQILHTFAGTVGPAVKRPAGDVPACDFLDRNYVCVLHDGRVVPCSMDEAAETVLGTVDDLDSIRQQEAYELCRSCEGFRFHEGFRGFMQGEVASPTPRVADRHWRPHLRIDDDPKAWRT